MVKSIQERDIYTKGQHFRYFTLSAPANHELRQHLLNNKRCVDNEKLESQLRVWHSPTWPVTKPSGRVVQCMTAKTTKGKCTASKAHEWGFHFIRHLKARPGMFSVCFYKAVHKSQENSTSFLPIEGHGKIILPFNADVWVPLVQGLRVLLKHPLVPSGDTAWRQTHC